MTEPLVEHLIVLRADFQAQAAAVGDLCGGFEEHEAATGTGGEHTPPAAVLDEGGVIGQRIETEHRELETVLPGGLAVARAAVAAELGEDRYHIVLKVYGRVHLEALHLDRDGGLEVSDSDEQGGSPVGHEWIPPLV